MLAVSWSVTLIILSPKLIWTDWTHLSTCWVRFLSFLEQNILNYCLLLIALTSKTFLFLIKTQLICILQDSFHKDSITNGIPRLSITLPGNTAKEGNSNPRDNSIVNWSLYRNEDSSRSSVLHDKKQKAALPYTSCVEVIIKGFNQTERDWDRKGPQNQIFYII